eukprot:5077824-Pyramimonas_sp.AAC.1
MEPSPWISWSLRQFTISDVSTSRGKISPRYEAFPCRGISRASPRSGGASIGADCWPRAPIQQR